MSNLRILMLGDIVGKSGREVAESMLPTLQETYSPDFCIVNGENSAAGKGITPEIARSFLKSGVDVITLGNHTWGKRDIGPYLDGEPRILRPANYPAGTPGSGAGDLHRAQRYSGGCRQRHGTHIHGTA